MSDKVPNPRKKWIFVISTAIVSLLMFGLIFEGAVRIRQWVKYGTPTALHDFTRDPKTGLRIPGPGTGIGRIQVNSHGFRSPEIPIQKDKGTIRIAFLGGSTTWCAEVSGNEMTWPHLVWTNLQQTYPDTKFDYLNAGIPGYTTEESLTRLKASVKKFKPDVIVIYHAVNDLSYDTRLLAENQGVFTGKLEDHSWLGKISLAWFLIEKNIDLYLRKQKAVRGNSSITFEARALSKVFEERLLNLVELSREVAPIVALATFSHKYRRSQPPEVQLQAAGSSLYYMPYMTVEKLFMALEEYNRVIREVAKIEKVILIKGENRIPGDDLHFSDSVHFADAGSEVMAQRVLEGLKGSVKFSKFLAENRI